MFGKKLRCLRKKSGMTQANLAKKLGISASAIGMYEQGRREPDSEMLKKIADLFDVSVDFLVDFKVDFKKGKIYKKNIDEIADKVEFFLRNKSYLKDSENKISNETLNSIVEAVREGILKVFEEEWKRKYFYVKFVLKTFKSLIFLYKKLYWNIHWVDGIIFI